MNVIKPQQSTSSNNNNNSTSTIKSVPRVAQEISKPNLTSKPVVLADSYKNALNKSINQQLQSPLAGSSSPSPIKQNKPQQLPQQQQQSSSPPPFHNQSLQRQQVAQNQSQQSQLIFQNQSTILPPKNISLPPTTPTVWNELQQHVAKKLLSNLDGNGNNNNTSNQQNEKRQQQQQEQQTANQYRQHLEYSTNTQQHSQQQQQSADGQQSLPPPPLWGCFTDIFNDEFFFIGAKAIKNVVHSAAREGLTSLQRNVGTVVQDQVNRVLTNNVLSVITGGNINNNNNGRLIQQPPIQSQPNSTISSNMDPNYQQSSNNQQLRQQQQQNMTYH